MIHNAPMMAMFHKATMMAVMVAVGLSAGVLAAALPRQSRGSESNPEPAPCSNNVVAHRGGSVEAGEEDCPDNSVAALKYAISLGVYASECDIYWTKDDNVIVAHADEEFKINGMHPWEHTLKEIRKAGKLSNGEKIPTLGEMLDVVMKESRCTRLWLDIKKVKNPSVVPEYSINAAKRACEIIKEKRAENFTEFICTSNPEVMAAADDYARAAGIKIGWMANKAASEYAAKGYTWANLNYRYMKHDGGKRTVEEFAELGIPVSVFVINDDYLMDYYVSFGTKLKAITTNYPAKLLKKIEASE